MTDAINVGGEGEPEPKPAVEMPQRFLTCDCHFGRACPGNLYDVVRGAVFDTLLAEAKRNNERLLDMTFKLAERAEAAEAALANEPAELAYANKQVEVERQERHRVEDDRDALRARVAELEAARSVQGFQL